MPEDLPEAVKILLWLLIGVIIFGYLLMAYAVIISFIFAAIYFGGPVIWRLTHKQE
jgi:hypothetical protein